ncbi:MAG: nicotinate-nucleotide--dimethylbenzimidazole phosphoribosyltransferase [Firmicutes bacterium]|nr:nicotinate-nucleotide--dimethylbenzimidazole phosphoribosyltransferase [Bacillota bacterium]
MIRKDEEAIIKRTQALIQALERAEPADRTVIDAAMQRLDDLAKPPGSLGGLETIAARMAGITGRSIPADAFPGKGCVIVFCADNGVVEQGVASAPQSVTRAQTINFTRRLTGVGALARSYGSELLIVDMGVKDPIPAELYDTIPFRDTHKIIDRKIRPATWDIAAGPAMTEAEALQAVETGIEMVRAAAHKGFDILGIGEMGIGNTTTSAAVLSCITGAKAGQTCGRGGGVNDTGFQRKQQIVGEILEEWQSRIDDAQEGVCDTADADYAGSDTQDASRGASDAGNELHGEADAPAFLAARLDRILKILTRCGGFDIAAMTGAYLGAAMERIPVVIDGYISIVAALAAAEILPAAADVMFASHQSAEPGYTIALRRLTEHSPGLEPFLALGMRLGEGSGCPIAFEIIRGACGVMRNMATFEEAEINDDYLEEVRRGGCF